MKEVTINYFKENKIYEQNEEILKKYSSRAEISVKKSKIIARVMEELLSTYERVEGIETFFVEFPFLKPIYDALRQQYIELWFKEFMYAHRYGILWLMYYKEKRHNMIRQYVGDYEKYLEESGFVEMMSRLTERDSLLAQNKNMCEALELFSQRLSQMEKQMHEAIAVDNDCVKGKEILQPK